MFIRQNFQFNRGIPNCQAQGEGFTSIQHTYRSELDSTALILNPGYFPDNFDENPGFVIPGDTILIIGSDKPVMVLILDVSPVVVGSDLFSSVSQVSAPFSVIAGNDFVPATAPIVDGVYVRGDAPAIGFEIFGKSPTNIMGYFVQHETCGFIGGMGGNVTGIITTTPEVALVNVNATMGPPATIVSLDNTGIVRIFRELDVDTIKQLNPGNGTTINGINLSTNGIQFPVSSNGGLLFNFQTNSLISFSWTGIWASPQPGKINIAAFNNTVIVTGSLINPVVANASSVIISPVGIIPTYARPAATKIQPIIVIDNAAATYGAVEINVAGTITIYATPTLSPFVGIGALCGTYSFSLTYDLFS